VFDQLRPALFNKPPCAFVLPTKIRSLGLPPAKGYFSEKQLLNPKVKVVIAEGRYNVQRPVALENGTGELVQRVHWRMTFKRIPTRS
jgi:hypothetical protein